MRPNSAKALLCVVVLLGACGGGRTSVAPSPSPSPSPTPAPPGQRFTLSGVVVGYNAAPLPGVVMEIMDGGNRGVNTTTDASGRYRFESLSAGTMAVRATAAGYVEAATSVSLTENLDASFRLDPIPAQFKGVEGQVGVLANRPAGTYGASVVNMGPGCALRLTATGKFLDKSLNTLRTMTWAADPAKIFRAGDTSIYEFCCILASEASQIFRVDVDFSYLNRPCS